MLTLLFPLPLPTASRISNVADMRCDAVRCADFLAQASGAAIEALKLLTFLSRPTVKAAGRLQKRLVIEEGGHDREQV